MTPPHPASQHWCTDTLGGAALGISCVSLLAMAVEAAEKLLAAAAAAGGASGAAGAGSGAGGTDEPLAPAPARSRR